MPFTGLPGLDVVEQRPPPRVVGYGLERMRDRASLLGGTFHAGRRPIVRTGLTTLLDAQPDIEVGGAAADGREAVRLALQLRPDVGLFDIRMPLLDGIEGTRRLAGPDVADPCRSWSSPPSTSTSMSTERSKPVPAGSCSRAPDPPC
jgi:CheY-like chemotaxis protein